MEFDFKKVCDADFIKREIARFKASERRRAMLTGEDYFAGRQDVLSQKRAVIGENGELEPVRNLPDNKAVDNQYRKLVNQKTGYILGRPLTFRCSDPRLAAKLDRLLDKGFMRMLKNLAKDAYNHGIAWVYPYYGEGGLRFKRLKGYEVIPGWRDFEHTELDYAIRLYETIDCSGDDEAVIERVEVFDSYGIHYFELVNDELTATAPYRAPYITAKDNDRTVGYGWGNGRIPLVAFKRDSDETPLICAVKSLQDGLNLILSNFWNAMEEDPRNTLLVLVNYDGENLAEFRRNLSAYGAVKVRTVDGAPGDLKTLRVEVNAENYRAIIDIFKRAIIENGMGFDAKDSRFGGSPNQMNIKSMYSDVDLDANETETEFQASLAELVGFISDSGSGAEFIFNRDMLMNESAVIDDCVKSKGILSDETIIANHPWVDNVRKEINKTKD